MTCKLVGKIILHRSSMARRFISTNLNCFDKNQGLGIFKYELNDFDTDYYLNPSNASQIDANIKRRKGVGNINKVLELHSSLNTVKKLNKLEDISKIERELVDELRKIPNKTHPESMKIESDEPKTIKIIGEPRKFNYKPKGIAYLSAKEDLARTENLALTNGPRSYVLKNDLAELEQALIFYTADKLLKNGFVAMSVPDTLDARVIENCGMATKGKRTQVFSIDAPWFDGSLCLSGTSEMALAQFFSNKCLKLSNLPQNVFAVSRCYRGEVSNLQEEKGIYRVHEFSKVEMFGLTANETGYESENLLNSFSDTQQMIFTELGLHFKVLDMPPHELGASAYRKYDIETWFPPKRFYGEISSASNCLDYQSRRLGIKYENDKMEIKHVHTVNATACAIPRLIMAIVENFQNRDGTIPIPLCLIPYMNGKKIIGGNEQKFKMLFQKLK